MSKEQTSKRRNWNQVGPYLLVAPALIYYVLFWIRPVFRTFLFSITDATGRLSLENFRLVLEDPTFIPAAQNTAIIVIFSVTLEFVAAMALALLINRKFKGSGILLFIAMIPMALAPVALGAMWKTGFTTHGWVNSFLTYIGFLDIGEKIIFLSGESRFKNLLLIILIDAWQVIPSMMIILLAGLQGLPKEMMEASYVFGANRWKTLRRITMPMLRPTIQTAVILRLISALQIWLTIVMLFGFGRVPVLLSRVIYYSEEVPNLTNSFRMSSTYSVVIAVIITIVAVMYLKVSGAFGRKNGGERS
ncbi:sugar ABC transporter permease [Gottschalkiaceae bacterium SANA]|nr:sugar ABC transporter permease [Gottschalkiaceae bacterium SANA]